MTPIVSLYTVIASMIGALALVSLVVRQLLEGCAALGWLSLALIGGFATTFLASFGIAPYRNGDSFSRLFALADTALYEVKTRGRNRTVVGQTPADSDAAPLASSA